MVAAVLRGRRGVQASARSIWVLRSSPISGCIACMSSTACDPRFKTRYVVDQRRAAGRLSLWTAGDTRKSRAARLMTSWSRAIAEILGLRESEGGGAKKLPSASSQPASQYRSLWVVFGAASTDGRSGAPWRHISAGGRTWICPRSTARIVARDTKNSRARPETVSPSRRRWRMSSDSS
jgi:hypothetical protein